LSNIGNDVLDILLGAGSVKYPTNQPLPSGKPVKPAKLREKGKRKAGDQEDREGRALKKIPNPDVTYDITSQAFKNDPDWQAVGAMARQVHDIKVKSLIIEHRTTGFINAKTDEKFPGEFPAGASVHVQFGAGVKTLVVCLRDCQRMSYERVAELISDVFGDGIGEAAVVSMVKETGNSHVLNKFETAASKDVAESPGVDADETGLKIGKTTRWAHVLAGALLALFSLDRGRGKAGMDATGILDRLLGFAVHDCRRT
jgi:hypothetical protein